MRSEFAKITTVYLLINELQQLSILLRQPERAQESYG